MGGVPWWVLAQGSGPLCPRGASIPGNARHGGVVGSRRGVLTIPISRTGTTQSVGSGTGSSSWTCLTLGGG
eukprot:5061725-Alexandrium_andersonii.AAC.1